MAAAEMVGDLFVGWSAVRFLGWRAVRGKIAGRVVIHMRNIAGTSKAGQTQGERQEQSYDREPAHGSCNGCLSLLMQPPGQGNLSNSDSKTEHPSACENRKSPRRDKGGQ